MILSIILTLPLFAVAQLVGDEIPEEHPPLLWSRCSPSGCKDVAGSLTIDGEMRWLHVSDSYENCHEGGYSSGAIWVNCTSNADCTARCALEGGDAQYNYQMDYKGKSVVMRYHQYLDFSQWMNLRLFLLEEENRYQTFTLMDNELAFDVDLSKVPCGLNAALRFVAMDADGGTERYPAQIAGAKYGTGYCDASCPRTLRWVGGQANYEGWEPSATDPYGGQGQKGACCSEMSVWNSNSISYTMDSRPCITHEYDVCVDSRCGRAGFADGPLPQRCAWSGCENNPFRLGNSDFYGPGKVVDTDRPFTVVTRFNEAGVKQFFIQDGEKIEPPAPAWEDIPDAGGINEEYCNSAPDVFDDRDIFNEVGGWAQHNAALRQPMVLALSIKDDHWAANLPLSGEAYPLDRDPAQPGVARGTCSLDDSDPMQLPSTARNAAVTFSNIRFGPIGTTVDVD